MDWGWTEPWGPMGINSELRAPCFVNECRVLLGHRAMLESQGLMALR